MNRVLSGPAALILLLFVGSCSRTGKLPAALVVETDAATAIAVPVRLDGQSGYLTPGHVCAAGRWNELKLTLAGTSVKLLELRPSQRRDLVFFRVAPDCFTGRRAELAFTAVSEGKVDFRLPPEPRTDFQGRSGTPGISAHGEPGLFLGLDRSTAERVFVRLDNLVRSEFFPAPAEATKHESSRILCR